MKFAAPLTEGRLIKRYKRFLADVELSDGQLITAHCPNTGSMLGVCEPGSRVWLSHSDSTTRKYAYTWELVEVGATLVGINTALPNRLVEEAIVGRRISALQGYHHIRREVRYGNEASRIDLLLTNVAGKACYVEVKNVTAAVSEGVALFPDAVSERGSKHLRELMEMVQQGHRAVLVFCVQRSDVKEVRPADDIDPVYGRTLREALAGGVEVLAYKATLSSREISLDLRLPVVCP
jgi:sugar fermentation stimulation protein A